MSERIHIAYPTRTSYEAVVPDTLDLAERAELALHGIARTVDPADEYMMWFGVYWCNRPPFLLHTSCDVECGPKFLDAMTLLRIASGSDEFMDIEQGMQEALLSYVSEDDGLYYALYKPERPWHMTAYASAGYETQPEDYAIPGTTGIMMTALIPRNDLSITPSSDLISAMARGLEKLSIQKGDYAYYPEGGGSGHPFTRPRSGWVNTNEPGDEHEGGEGTVVAYFGYPIRALAMWAEHSGDEQALEFAGKLARFVMRPKFWGHPADPPRVAGYEQGHLDSHFHARAIALRGLLEYGIVAGDRRACDFVRSAYEYMRTYGINEIGFIPCWPEMGRNTMEGCLLGDLVALTVKMSDAGLGDYWEDADRVIRNHLAEAQFVRRDLMERVMEISPERQPEETDEVYADKVHPGQVCYDDVLERSLGIFPTYLTPTSISGQRAIQCCTCNATRGLYYAWEPITRCSGDEAQVNLLLNRAAPWLDIHSYLPYEGKVVIHNKTARRLAVRIPAWVQRNHLTCTVNGTPRNLSLVGAYQVFENLQPHDQVELLFPVTETTITRTAHVGTEEETAHTITMRGNTVVDITPRDESPTSYPMYLRDHLRSDRAPMKTVQRFVSEQIARW